MESGELTKLSEELIERLGSGGDLEGIMSTDIYPTDDLYVDEDEDEDNEPDDVIILHMDIREPLRSLKKLIEEKIGVELTGYKFWLQDAQELEPHKNLVDQCVKGEGLVQINVQIQTTNQRINIVDVLKPTDAALAALSAEGETKHTATVEDHEMLDFESQDGSDFGSVHRTENNVKEKPCLNWVLDSKFKREQTRLKIPDDPNAWTVPQVKHWLQWAIRQFDLVDIKVSDWDITGRQLCELSHEEFRKKLRKDPGNVFWTHLQLLKECKFVSVVHKIVENLPVSGKSKIGFPVTEQQPRERKIMRKSTSKTTSQDSFSEASLISTNSAHTHGVGSGNNGQVQLWQFLLDILTDRDHIKIIQWVGNAGEFKLTDPERVARLWGDRKNKPAMNYEKLSRALRYYYDGDMISKVSGKRFAYKFDCDLKLLIGYDAGELSQLVYEKKYTDKSFLNQSDSVPAPSDEEFDEDDDEPDNDNDDDDDENDDEKIRENEDYEMDDDTGKDNK